jgi:hypothetical protein
MLLGLAGGTASSGLFSNQHGIDTLPQTFAG